MTDLEIVREACIRANPFTMPAGAECPYCKGRLCYCPERMLNGSWKSAGRPIRLADVLLAIGGKLTVKIEGDTKLVMRDAYTQEQHEIWTLRTDDLSQQSLETLQFLANLLRVSSSSSRQNEQRPKQEPAA